MDSNGSLAISNIYDSVSARGFSDGLAIVMLNNKWGAINASGNMAVNNEYETLFDFVGGFAVAVLNQKCGVIDIAGNVIVPFEHELIGFIGEGRAFALNHDKWQLITLER